MSKGNMLLGHARGKVGDLVFSRVNGQQVTRARAAVVKNPQTEAQMIQRILLNTIIQAYSRMSEICDHSFEGVQTGQKSMSAFMRKNLNQLRTFLASERESGHLFDEIYSFSPLGSNQFAMNEYIIATGTLPAVTTSVDASLGGIVAITASGAGLTYADVINGLGLQRGDQLTFIIQEAWSDGRAAFKFARVILDPRDADGNELSLDTLFLTGTAINQPNSKNETEEITFNYTNSQLRFYFEQGTSFGAAVIVSRQRTDGTWLRSNTSIVLEDAMPYSLINNYTLQECLDAAAAGSLDLVNARYLNNARRLASGDVSGSAGSPELYVIPIGHAIPSASEYSSLSKVKLVGVYQGTEGTNNAVIGYDAAGQEYLLFGNNTYANTYNKLYGNMKGANQAAGQWFTTPVSGEPEVVASTRPLVGIYVDADSDSVYDEMTAWLINQGCDAGTIING